MTPSAQCRFHFPAPPPPPLPPHAQDMLKYLVKYVANEGLPQIFGILEDAVVERQARGALHGHVISFTTCPQMQPRTPCASAPPRRAIGSGVAAAARRPGSSGETTPPAVPSS